jgi:hypothetical protein
VPYLWRGAGAVASPLRPQRLPLVLGAVAAQDLGVPLLSAADTHHTPEGGGWAGELRPGELRPRTCVRWLGRTGESPRGRSSARWRSRVSPVIGWCGKPFAGVTKCVDAACLDKHDILVVLSGWRQNLSSAHSQAPPCATASLVAALADSARAGQSETAGAAGPRRRTPPCSRSRARRSPAPC